MQLSRQEYDERCRPSRSSIVTPWGLESLLHRLCSDGARARRVAQLHLWVQPQNWLAFPGIHPSVAPLIMVSKIVSFMAAQRAFHIGTRHPVIHSFFKVRASLQHAAPVWYAAPTMTVAGRRLEQRQQCPQFGFGSIYLCDMEDQ